MNPSRDDVELEAALLKSLAIKSNYDKFYNVLDTKKLIPITDRLLKNYKTYYDKYNEDIDWTVFYTEFTQNMSKDLDKDDIAYYRETVFPLIRNSEIGNHVYTSLLEREASHKLEQIIANGFCVDKAQEVILSLKSELQGYQKGNDEDVFKLGSLDLTTLDTANGLEWKLKALQAALGSHMPGQFVVVSADSNAGKSAFCISQAVYVFEQLNRRKETRPIIYCTSEDTKEDLSARFLSNLYKAKCPEGFEQIIREYERVKKHFISNYNEELFLGHQIRSHKDMYKLRDKVEKYSPAYIIIDMLDTLSESGDHQHLKASYDSIRGLANDGFPILGTTQSGDTTYWGQDADGKPQRMHRKKLSEKDAAGSKFGKQGAAYCMIGIGQDDNMPGVRYITTTKKKRGRHCSVTCILNEKFSEYEELL